LSSRKGGLKKLSFEFTIKVGGEAGQGIQTIGAVLARAFQRGGLNVFGVQHYYSRVRGGHNYFQVRVSDTPILAMREGVNMLIALDRTSIDKHLTELEDGVVVVDRDVVKINEKDPSIFHVPILKIAEEKGGGKLYSNTVATGAALGLLCYDFNHLKEVLLKTFSKKGDDVINKNIATAKEGYDFAQSNYPDKCHYVLRSREKSNKRMLITGNEAVGLGALASGLKFLSAYPMTPSTGVMNYIAAYAEGFKVVVEQAEDEISALNMALGASFMGARSMTTTSGGGFSLMVEALGLAGMTETPVVIFLSQRPGPATGLPTMTEQGDLEFVLHAAQGEFPRCVLAPKTPDDAFYLTSKAFNIADKYQIPVFILSDQYLADTIFTCNRFDMSRIKIEKHLLSDSEVKGKEYKRYILTSNGISPRALPGQNGALVIADSDEHDEEGHIDESIDNRVKMNDKRLKKLELLRKEISAPEVYGGEDVGLTLIGWGSTFGPLSETVDMLNTKESKANLIHFSEIYPLPLKTVRSILENTAKTICVENNATGQFARILKVETDFKVSDEILKYDGRPFTPEAIIRELKKRGAV
jgi:2-oxoglutarate ferredoxin oxidoreductase subunit alpha